LTVAVTNVEIDIDKTILFFDEIQVSERAISSLKYFCESEKNYKIVLHFKKSYSII